MISLYLDDNITWHALARALRAAGHAVLLPPEVGSAGAADEVHLETSSRMGVTLVTTDQGDYDRLWELWRDIGRTHAGILICHQVSLSLLIQWLDRAARLLSPDRMQNQLVRLEMFRTEELGLATVQSLA